MSIDFTDFPIHGSVKDPEQYVAFRKLQQIGLLNALCIDGFNFKIDRGSSVWRMVITTKHAVACNLDRFLTALLRRYPPECCNFDAGRFLRIDLNGQSVVAIWLG